MDELSPGRERTHSVVGGDRTRSFSEDAEDTPEEEQGEAPPAPPRHESFAMAQIMS